MVKDLRRWTYADWRSRYGKVGGIEPKEKEVRRGRKKTKPQQTKHEYRELEKTSIAKVSCVILSYLAI